MERPRPRGVHFELSSGESTQVMLENELRTPRCVRWPLILAAWLQVLAAKGQDAQLYDLKRLLRFCSDAQVSNWTASASALSSPWSCMKSRAKMW